MSKARTLLHITTALQRWTCLQVILLDRLLQLQTSQVDEDLRGVLAARLRFGLVDFIHVRNSGGEFVDRSLSVSLYTREKWDQS